MERKNISYTVPEIAKRFENHIRKNNYNWLSCCTTSYNVYFITAPLLASLTRSA